VDSIIDSSALLGSLEADQRYLAILDQPLYACLVDLQDLVSYETAQFWRAPRLPLGRADRAARGLTFDAELLYAGAMFHDMGLTHRHSRWLRCSRAGR
jgi:hypothetical protein